MNLRFGQTIANKTSLGKHTQLNKIDIWKPTQVDLYYTCANVDQLVPRVEINKHMGQLHDVESSFGSFLARTDDSVNHLPPRNVMSSLHTWMVFKHGKHMGGCITWVATCCNTTILPTVCWVSKSWDPNKNKQTNKRHTYMHVYVCTYTGKIQWNHLPITSSSLTLNTHTHTHTYPSPSNLFILTSFIPKPYIIASSFACSFWCFLYTPLPFLLF